MNLKLRLLIAGFQHTGNFAYILEEVGLNTHSVNLSMDIAKLATLKTDTGLSVNALSWNGENGGHHVSGTLTFPAQIDGKALLKGAKVLTLVIQNVDAPERTFTWKINSY